jgi:hypothetical protein
MELVDLKNESTLRAPALQAQSPEFKPQFHITKKKKKGVNSFLRQKEAFYELPAWV